MTTIPLFALIAAMIVVESGGNDHAMGDQGRAYGCLQIHSIVVRDVNRIAKTRFTHRDAFDRKKSMAICSTYLTHYATAERLGRPVTAEDMARIWNGGPDGWKERGTLDYWLKVKAELQRQGYKVD